MVFLQKTIEYYEQVYPYIKDVNPNNALDVHFSVYAWNNGQIEKITDHNGIITTIGSSNSDIAKN